MSLAEQRYWFMVGWVQVYPHATLEEGLREALETYPDPRPTPGMPERAGGR